MTEYEIISIMLTVNSLMLGSGVLIVSVLTFFDKKNKR